MFEHAHKVREAYDAASEVDWADLELWSHIANVEDDLHRSPEEAFTDIREAYQQRKDDQAEMHVWSLQADLVRELLDEGDYLTDDHEREHGDDH